MGERLEQERTRIQREEQAKAQAAADGELGALRDELADRKLKLAQAQEAELAVRRERADLEEQKRSFDLEVQRQVDEARRKVREQTQREAGSSSTCSSRTRTR